MKCCATKSFLIQFIMLAESFLTSFSSYETQTFVKFFGFQLAANKIWKVKPSTNAMECTTMCLDDECWALQFELSTGLCRLSRSRSIAPADLVTTNSTETFTAIMKLSFTNVRLQRYLHYPLNARYGLRNIGIFETANMDFTNVGSLSFSNDAPPPSVKRSSSETSFYTIQGRSAENKNVSLALTNSFQNTKGATTTMWMKRSTTQSAFLLQFGAAPNILGFSSYSPSDSISHRCQGIYTASASVPNLGPNMWHFMTWVLEGKNLTFLVNGTRQYNNPNNGLSHKDCPPNQNAYLGKGTSFAITQPEILFSNVAMYWKPLSTEEIREVMAESPP
jgi:hypothetical protein